MSKVVDKTKTSADSASPAPQVVVEPVPVTPIAGKNKKKAVKPDLTFQQPTQHLVEPEQTPSPKKTRAKADPKAKSESEPSPKAKAKQSEPEKESEVGALYVFTNPDFEAKCLYKIGYVKTNDALKARLRALTCGNPDGRFVQTWESVVEPFQVEKDIHLLHKRRLNHYEKEWFKIENINLAIEEMSARINGRKLARQPASNNYEAESEAFLYHTAQGIDKCLTLAVDAIRNGESLNQEKFSMLKVPKKEDEYKKFCLEFPQSNGELKKFLLNRCCAKEIIEVYQHQMLFQNKKSAGLAYVSDMIRFATFALK